MRILCQIALLSLICLLCEGVASLFPFPFPGSVLSMIVLFLLFFFKVLKPEQMKESAGFLLGNMMLVFLPSFISVVNYFDLLRQVAVPFILIIVISTVVTFFVGGAVVCLVFRLQEGRRSGKEEPR